MLYEMVGGRRPFGGDSQSALIGAIMASEPPSLATLRPGVPRAIEQLVSGALVKDRDERWQSMRDVTRALTMAAAVEADAAPGTARSRRPLFIAIGALGAAVVAMATAWLVWGRPSDPTLVRFDLDAIGSGQIQRFTDTRPYFAASPDGSRIAFAATVDNRQDIWVRRIDSERPERLADTTGGTSPFWSPDGQSIGFAAGGHVKRKALGAGPAQVLCDAESSLGVNGTWNREGVVLFAEWGKSRLMRVSENGGTPIVVRQQTPALGFPQFLPDGRHFLYIVPDVPKSTGHGFVGSLDAGGGTDTPIPGVASHMEFSAGRLIFWREGSLVAQPFDTKTFQLTGEAVSLAEQIHGFVVTGSAAFSASPRLLVYQAGAAGSRLVWTDRQGLEQETVGPVADYLNMRLSPDEPSVAFSARDPRLGSNDIFIQELRRPITRPFTSDRGTESVPIWSPAGQTIVYAADRHDAPNLQARAADGTGSERELLEWSPIGAQVPSSFTPDGHWLLFSKPNLGTGYDIMMIPTDHHADPVPVVQTKGRDTVGRLSVDGQWLAFQSDVSGRTEVYVQPLHDPHARRQVSQDGGSDPKWRADGKELFYLGVDRRQVMAVDMTVSSATIEPRTPRLLFVRHARVADYDVTKDGKRFLLIAPDPIAERGTLSAVVNWMKLIKP